MILDSLVNHILRALAGYSLLSLWVAQRKLAYEHELNIFFVFWVLGFCLFVCFFGHLKNRQNTLKIIESPFTGTKIEKSKEISAQGYNLYFTSWTVDVLSRSTTNLVADSRLLVLIYILAPRGFSALSLCFKHIMWYTNGCQISGVVSYPLQQPLT